MKISLQLPYLFAIFFIAYAAGESSGKPSITLDPTGVTNGTNSFRISFQVNGGQLKIQDWLLELKIDGTTPAATSSTLGRW